MEGYKEYQYTGIDDCARLGLAKTYEELSPANSVSKMVRWRDITAPMIRNLITSRDSGNQRKAGKG